MECGARFAAFSPGQTGTAPNVAPAVEATLQSAPAAAIALAPAAPPVVNTPGSTIHGTPSPETAPRESSGIVQISSANDSVSIPMRGPSRKQIALGGAGIAIVSLALGAVVAWRAFKPVRPQVDTAPIEPETAVALIEAPHALVSTINSDGGARANNGRGTGRTNSNGTVVATRSNGTTASESTGGSHAGTTGTTGSTGSTGTTGTRTGSTGATTGTTSGATTGTRTGSTGSTASTGSTGSTGSAPAIGSGNDPGGEGPGPTGPAIGGYREGEATDATGTIDPSSFQLVYRHYRSQISACHSQVTRNGQDVSGTMRVRIRIGAGGRVTNTRIMEDSTHNTALETCVQTAIRTWRYPTPEGGEVDFEYNLGFGN